MFSSPGTSVSLGSVGHFKSYMVKIMTMVMYNVMQFGHYHKIQTHRTNSKLDKTHRSLP